jgi:hypothetical protein
LADVEAITALLVEIEQHDLGEVLIDLDDVAASMRAPGFDP